MQTTTKQACPVCKGTGKVTKVVTAGIIGQRRAKVTCQHCRGTGQAGRLQTK